MRIELLLALALTACASASPTAFEPSDASADARAAPAADGASTIDGASARDAGDPFAACTTNDQCAEPLWCVPELGHCSLRCGTSDSETRCAMFGGTCRDGVPWDAGATDAAYPFYPVCVR